MEQTMGYANNSTVLAFVLVAGAAASVTGAATAADNAAAWAGPYAGIELGGNFQNNEWKAQSVGPNNVFGVDSAYAKSDLSKAAGRIGGYGGYSLAVAPDVIVGVEADIAGDLGGKKSVAGIPGAAYGLQTPADGISARADWDASIRARAGYVLDPALLLFGTAGVAFEDNEYKASCPSGGLTSWCAQPETASKTKTAVGFTLGGGAEARISDNLSLRAEYRYADFSSTTVNLFSGYDQVSTKVDPSSHLVILGLTYHFGAL
jgi:outer membrane immunogenic protein